MSRSFTLVVSFLIMSFSIVTMAQAVPYNFYAKHPLEKRDDLYRIYLLQSTDLEFQQYAAPGAIRPGGREESSVEITGEHPTAIVKVIADGRVYSFMVFKVQWDNSGQVIEVAIEPLYGNGDYNLRYDSAREFFIIE